MSEIIYGIHTVYAFLKHKSHLFISVFLLKGRNDQRMNILFQEFKKKNILIKIVSRQFLNNKVRGAVHQGIIALVRSEKKFQEADLPQLLTQWSLPFLLILDSITDPHNLGSCLRCANAAGVNAVIASRNRVLKINATVKKVASGATENIPMIRVTNLVRTLRLLQNYNISIIGTVIKSNRNLYQTKLTGPLAIVIGSEDKGIRQLTRKHCDDLIKIPTISEFSSLNVSVAAGICLFEAVRQRTLLNKKID